MSIFFVYVRGKDENKPATRDEYHYALDDDTVLRDHQIIVNKGSERDPGDPTDHDIWTMILADRTNGDRIFISFRVEARDELIAQLNDSGLVLAKHI